MAATRVKQAPVLHLELTTPVTITKAPKVRVHTASTTTAKVAIAKAVTARTAPSVRAKGVTMAHRAVVVPKAFTTRITEALKKRLKDGDVAFTMVPENRVGNVGETWKNFADATFYIASEPQISWAVEEWADSEYEFICEMLASSTPSIPLVGFETGLYAHPEPTTLLDAWNCVLGDSPGSNFHINVTDSPDPGGSHYGYTQMTATELMSWMGLGKETLRPMVVMAEVLTKDDWKRLQDNDFVGLEGYKIVATETDDDNMLVTWIEPK